MAINVSLIAGAQIFRSDDKPSYHRAWTVIVGVISLGVASVCTLLFLYIVANRKIVKESCTQHQPSMHSNVAEGESMSGEEIVIPHKTVYNI